MRSTPTAGLQRADAIDPSSLRSPINTSYTEIRNLEIVVQGHGLQPEFNPENQETKVTGEALLYPGLKPRNGDLFITPMGDALFGVFQVTSETRLTYRQGANHRITFFLREYATNDGIEIIRRSVTKIAYFDKTTYLGDATTLLSEESYRWYQTLQRMRHVLIKEYFKAFFDKQMNSIIAPNGTYDPYLVQFLNGMISILDSQQRPGQLYAAIQNYDCSLWGRMNDATNRTLTGLQSAFNLMRFEVSRWDIAITAVANRVIVILDNPTQQSLIETPIVPSYYVPPSPVSTVMQSLKPVSMNQSGYVLSANFYNGDTSLMTPIEYMIYTTIVERKLIAMGDFIDGYLTRYAELSYEQRFYAIPLYLWLIYVGVNNISITNTFMT